MKTRVMYLAIACSAASLSANVLGGCGGTQPQATVNVAPPPPAQQQTTAPMVAPPQIVAVGPTWVPGGVYDDVATNMSVRARQYAAGYGVASDLVRANIREGLAGVTVPGTVQAGFCYRIIAVGGQSVRDLDLFLYDQTGREVDHDRSPDNYPVIGLARPLCIPPGMPPISAQLRIRAYAGSGPIGVQMFATPFNGQMQAAPMMGQPGMMVGQPGVVYAPR
jgi:hypothetical protein